MNTETGTKKQGSKKFGKVPYRKWLHSQEFLGLIKLWQQLSSNVNNFSKSYKNVSQEIEYNAAQAKITHFSI